MTRDEPGTPSIDDQGDARVIGPGPALAMLAVTSTPSPA